MTDTNPRDLIKRLADIADALDGRKPLVSAQGQVMDGFTALANFRALAGEARAYLAQPEPEGPTDKQLLGCMLKAAASVPGGQCTGILDWAKEAIAAARAVLARWGK